MRKLCRSIVDAVSSWPMPRTRSNARKNHRWVIHIGNRYLSKYTTKLASLTSWSCFFQTCLFIYSTIMYMCVCRQIYRVNFFPTCHRYSAAPRYDKPSRHPPHQTWWRKHQDSVVQVYPDPAAILGQTPGLGAWRFLLEIYRIHALKTGFHEPFVWILFGSCHVELAVIFFDVFIRITNLLGWLARYVWRTKHNFCNGDVFGSSYPNSMAPPPIPHELLVWQLFFLLIFLTCYSLKVCPTFTIFVGKIYKIIGPWALQNSKTWGVFSNLGELPSS